MSEQAALARALRRQMQNRAMAGMDPTAEQQASYDAGAGERQERGDRLTNVLANTMTVGGVDAYQRGDGPVKFLGDTAAAGAAGLASLASPLLSEQAQKALAEQSARNPYASVILPMAAPVGAAASGMARALRTNPRTSAAVAGGTVAATPSAAGEETAYDRRMRDLNQQRATVQQSVTKLQAERDALAKALETEGSTGKGARWRDANKRLTDWDTANAARLSEDRARLSAIDTQISNFDSENSPAAVRKRQAELPTKDLYPTQTMAAQLALAGGGLAAGMAMKGRHIGKHNSEIKDLANGLRASGAEARTAMQAGDAATAASRANEAAALAKQLREIEKAGASKAGTVWPAIAGFELGAFAPTAADYYRSGGDPTSPLYKKAVQSMVGSAGLKEAAGVEVPGSDAMARIAMAGLLGAGASKIGNAAVTATKGMGTMPRAEMARTGALVDEVTGQQGAVTAQQMARHTEDGLDATIAATAAAQERRGVLADAAQSRAAAVEAQRRSGGRADAPESAQTGGQSQQGQTLPVKSQPDQQPVPIDGSSGGLPAVVAPDPIAQITNAVQTGAMSQQQAASAIQDLTRTLRLKETGLSDDWGAQWSGPARAYVDDLLASGETLARGRGGNLTGPRIQEAIAQRAPGAGVPSSREASTRAGMLMDDIGAAERGGASQQSAWEALRSNPSYTRFMVPPVLLGGTAAMDPEQRRALAEAMSGM